MHTAKNPGRWGGYLAQIFVKIPGGDKAFCGFPILGFIAFFLTSFQSQP
jgi:hypothetical protein